MAEVEAGVEESVDTFMGDCCVECISMVFGCIGWFGAVGTGMPMLYVIAICSSCYLAYQCFIQSWNGSRSTAAAWKLNGARMCLSCFSTTITVVGLFWLLSQVTMIEGRYPQSAEEAHTMPDWDKYSSEEQQDIIEMLNRTNYSRDEHLLFVTDSSAKYVESMDVIGGFLVFMAVPCPAMLIKFGIDAALDQAPQGVLVAASHLLGPVTILGTTAWAMLYGTFARTGCSGGCWFLLMIVIGITGAASLAIYFAFINYHTDRYTAAEDSGIPSPGQIFGSVTK